jgi:hypothetical protein
MIRVRSGAWIALLATLFSAASPTFAALLLSDKAALGQMLGLRVVASEERVADDHNGHAEHGAAHSDPAGDARDDDSHESHGIYCSLCLNPSSLATVAALPPSLRLLGLQFDLAAPELYAAPSASFLPLYRSRAPPATS